MLIFVRAPAVEQGTSRALVSASIRKPGSCVDPMMLMDQEHIVWTQSVSINPESAFICFLIISQSQRKQFDIWFPFFLTKPKHQRYPRLHCSVAFVLCAHYIGIKLPYLARLLDKAKHFPAPWWPHLLCFNNAAQSLQFAILQFASRSHRTIESFKLCQKLMPVLGFLRHRHPPCPGKWLLDAVPCLQGELSLHRT